MAERRKILDDLFDAFTITAGANYVSLYDAVGKMTRYSAASVELFGLPGEYIPDGSDNWADYVHPEDRNKYTGIMGELLSGTAHTYNLTYRVRMADGDYGRFRFIGAILRNEETGIPELVGGIMQNEGLLDNTDSVTVLRNQYGFLTDLETSIELRHAQSILYMGISGMAEINEKYGYGFGNHLLQQVAWIIQEQAARYGTIYRMEGAKFAMMSDHLDNDGIRGIYETIRQSLISGIDVDDTRLTLTINGGLVTIGDSPVSALTVLGSMRYVYKESRQNRHGRLVDFDRNDQITDDKRLRLINVVRECIIDDCRGFDLRYQPVFADGGGTKIGVEALVRFSSEEYGEIDPTRYVPVLERDVIFEELGYWILNRCMRDGLRIVKDNPDFIIGVNVASAQIEDDYFVEELTEVSGNVGFPLHNLCLELTKDCRQLDADVLRDVTGRLKALGVRIIIDDFGSGLSSIDFLRDLKPDCIKFDMKYIEDIMNNEEDRKIIHHLSELAVACGTEVCIKGVETREVYDIVSAFNVHMMQGFYLGRPVSAGEM